MTDERAEFGARLRRQRELRSMTVPDVSRVTKIPEKSVNLLENAAFDELPGDVFVRGFLKSYCRAVGLETEPTLRDYDALRGKGISRPTLTRPGVRTGEPAQLATPPRAAVKPAPAPAPAPAATATATAPTSAPDAADESSIFTALRTAGHGSSRLPLTMAVIILVIVATLTLSLLLRRPGHAGSGVSRGDSATSATAPVA